MKKFFILLLTVMMLSLVFAGCGQAPTASVQPSADESASADASASASDTASADASASAEDTSAVSSAPVSGLSAPAASYTAFVQAKSAALTRLTDGLSNNEQTTFATMTLLGVSMADLEMLPVSFFGAGQDAAAVGLAILNAKDVKYSENGNSTTISYANEQGDAFVFNGTYDAAADALSCTSQKNGKDYFYSEYRKTSYGYVSQYYFINDDSTTSLYQFTVSGEDCAFGYSTAQTSQPAALTGSEAVDFPTALPEWYSITGTAIKGMMSDGTEVNFEYVPTPTE